MSEKMSPCYVCLNEECRSERKCVVTGSSGRRKNWCPVWEEWFRKEWRELQEIFEKKR